MAEDPNKKRPALQRRASQIPSALKPAEPKKEGPKQRSADRVVEKWSKQQLNYWLEANNLSYLAYHFLENDEEKKAFDPKKITEETSFFDKHPDRTNLLVLIKAPLKKLFTMLTMEPKSDLRKIWEHELFIEQMFTVLHFVTTPKDLLTSLEERYKFIPPIPKDADDEEAKQPRTNIEAPVVIEVLKAALQSDFVNDLRADEALAKQFKTFCDKTIAKDNEKASKEIRKILDKKLKVSKKTKTDSWEDAPLPLTPKSSKVTSLADVDPVELARQMTLIEEKLFLAIRPGEFFHQAWNKANKETDAPNLTKFTNNCNKMINWVTTEILKVQEVKERAEIISKFIRVAKACEQLKNYNGVMEVLSSLHGSAVSRLKASWAEIPVKVKEAFDEISETMSNIGNFKTYRELFNGLEDTEPCIPFIAVFLTDYVYLDDLAQDKVDGLVNWRKMGQLADKIRDIRRYNMGRYHLTPVQSIQQFIEDAETWNDSKTLYAISQMAEGRDGTVTSPTDANAKKGSLRQAMGLKVRRTTLSTLTFKSSGSSGSLDGAEDPNAMTDREWATLLAGAQLKTYKPNEVVVEKDAKNDRIYRVKTGRVRIEKEVEGAKQTIATINAGDFFGETSMLKAGGRNQTFNAVAIAEEPSDVSIIQVEFVIRLCATDPELSEILHKNVALKQARRLRNLNANRTKKPEQSTPAPAPGGKSPSTPSSTSSAAAAAAATRAEAEEEAQRLDAKFQKKFGLPSGEVIVNAFDCSFKSTPVSHGTLFVTPNFLCYSATVFGLKKKEVITIRTIKSMELEKDKQITFTLTDSSKESTFSSFIAIKEAFDYIHTIWTQIQTKAAENSQGSLLTTKKKSKKGEEESDAANGKPAASALPKFELTLADWEAILKGSSTVTYAKNSPVVAEGDKTQRIYQMERGSCRIEKQGIEKMTVLGKMTKDDGVFGEISFLEGGSATASVVADEDQTVVSIIAGYFLNILFERDPGLSGRFYFYLAQLLAKRIQQRELGVMPNKPLPALPAAALVGVTLNRSPSGSTGPKLTSSKSSRQLTSSDLEGDTNGAEDSPSSKGKRGSKGSDKRKFERSKDSPKTEPTE